MQAGNWEGYGRLRRVALRRLHRHRRGVARCHGNGEGLLECRGMEDALSAYLDEPENSKHIFPMPDPTLKGRNIVTASVDPKVAMAMVLRQSRLESKLTQRQVADKLGMKHIFQYQKLESGKTANPELATLVKLKGVFPNLSVDAVLY
jgi:antitoxin HicB